MRIGYDAKRMFHNWRGLGNYSRELVTGLKYFYPENEYLLFTPPFNDERGFNFKKDFGEDNVITPIGFLDNQFPSIWRRNLVTELKKNKIELFHGLSHEVPYGLKKNGIKSIVTIHDLIFIRYPEYFPWIDRKVYLSKIKHAIREVDLIIAICEQTKNDLINFLNVPAEKIRVCYQSCHEQYQNGPVDSHQINLIKSKYGLERDYFLFVGAFEARKNILNLIEGMSYFGTSKDLVIVGRENSFKMEIDLKIRQMNLENTARVLTNVPTEDLPALYSGAEIFCFPSFFEGFGIPIIEAMFCETPVLTSHGSCFPEVAGEGAFYVDPESPFQIGKALYELTKNPELLSRLKKGASKQVKKFTSQKTNKELYKVYLEIMSS